MFPCISRCTYTKVFFVCISKKTFGVVKARVTAAEILIKKNSHGGNGLGFNSIEKRKPFIPRTVLENRLSTSGVNVIKLLKV